MTQEKSPIDLRGVKSSARVAVLASGGLDSAVLLALLARRAAGVEPLFVAGGHPWEVSELTALKRFIKVLADARIAAPVRLEFPVRATLNRYWGQAGYRPAFHQGYEANYIPGRNIALLSAVAIHCFTRGIDTVALGICKGNPYPDAQPAFLRAFEGMVRRGMGFKLRVLTPFIACEKEDLVMAALDLPLRETLSCVNPKAGKHCGLDCNKCAERQKAFALAGITDPTVYAKRPPRVDWAKHAWSAWTR